MDSNKYLNKDIENYFRDMENKENKILNLINFNINKNIDNYWLESTIYKKKYNININNFDNINIDNIDNLYKNFLNYYIN